MPKRYVQSGSPPAWDVPIDDEAKRAANRDRVARGKTKKSRTVTKDPKVADKKRARWKSRDRALKAAAEGRQVKGRE